MQPSFAFPAPHGARRPVRALAPFLLAISAGLLAIAGCGPEGAPSPRRSWSEVAPVGTAVDTNADPRIVELDLVAAPERWTLADGRSIEGMAYGGTFPGPTIEAHVGDTVIVHFRNELPHETTIHWHGVRVPIEMDGGPHSQAPIPAGGTFEYRFVVEDEGTFWYHPHANEPEDMERGLYGAIVVRGDDEPEVDTETVVMLDDLTLDASGALAPFGALHEAHAGREGDVQLVNGALPPRVEVRSGERQRWRIVNAGSARVYRLTLEGHDFTVLGSDGGPWARPTSVTELVLAPGDRMDVLVDIALAPGDEARLQARPYDRGGGAGVTAAIDVATLVATLEAPLDPRAPYDAVRVIEPLPIDGVTPTGVTFNQYTTDTEVTFLVNGETYPDVTPIPATVGEVQVWDVTNGSGIAHPFHLHGFFFQILSRNDVPVASPTWEDTFELRASERVRIAFRPDDRPGMWMFHCHILEHVHGGMMGILEVSR